MVPHFEGVGCRYNTDGRAMLWALCGFSTQYDMWEQANRDISAAMRIDPDPNLARINKELKGKIQMIIAQRTKERKEAEDAQRAEELEAARRYYNVDAAAAHAAERRTYDATHSTPTSSSSSNASASTTSRSSSGSSGGVGAEPAEAREEGNIEELD